MSRLSYDPAVKTLTIRLPDSLVTEIERESQTRGVSKSDIVRERLGQPQRGAAHLTLKDLAGDLVGSVSGLPSDLSSNKKKHLTNLIRAKKLRGR
jgi:hypothetical protein